MNDRSVQPVSVHDPALARWRALWTPLAEPAAAPAARPAPVPSVEPTTPTGPAAIFALQVEGAARTFAQASLPAVAAAYRGE